MSGIGLRNLVALVLAVGLASAMASMAAGDTSHASTDHAATHPVSLVGDQQQIADARGVVVPIQAYQRIVSLSLVSDHVVLEWCDPGRVVGFSSYSTGRDRRRIADRPRLDGLTSIEAVLALEPDLVLLSGGAADVDRVARLRERGIQVFDLGAAYGLPALSADLRALGALLGHVEAGDRLAWSVQHRLASCAATLPADRAPRRALVLHSYADQLFGGTRARDGRASSYHAVITAAGLVDVAADRFSEAWPQIPSELLPELAPELIVTREGQAAILRAHPALAAFGGDIIELPAELWDHPGPPMADAAELLFRRVWVAP